MNAATGWRAMMETQCRHQSILSLAGWPGQQPARQITELARVRGNSKLDFWATLITRNRRRWAETRRWCSAVVSALAAFEAWRRVTLHSQWFLFVSALCLRTYVIEVTHGRAAAGNKGLLKLSVPRGELSHGAVKG